MKTKVKFKNIDEVIWFSANANNIKGDVNLYDGSVECDAKSLVALIGLDLSKVFEIELIKKDPEDELLFNRLAESYRPMR